MATTTPGHLAARKKPLQARSMVTLDAIFEATIQVLLAQGLNRLTTTRVADRAGVSVGTMYQYFPHKQALLYALNERYLDMVADRIETTCSQHAGVPIAEMVDALVNTYWAAKTERSDVTRALYRAAVELDNDALIATFAQRVDTATIAMFCTAPDARFADLPLVNTTLLAVIFGTVRNVFERRLPAGLENDVRDQLAQMCRSYLNQAALTDADAPS
ncbi:TetR/AcrR family transcriptional regulator [Devosia sp. J2-20]|uniref:TetR/AcrR family transcriptional regulator n=1 Tax=Devosia sp. J2-20 TaxID=3026161 RepID=UPI00249CE54A|nr:TetR/AcrR family transcriptional regulator [Devosia sp. J2-20]WDQ99315.1 TetR/AcrR family transcriptional regulator [Devosia sp. J2-20]